MDKTKFRILDIDTVAGIMIIRMILGHCCLFSHFSTHSMSMCCTLLGFFMPWFFYKSGKFFIHQKDGIELLKKDARKYLRYFIVYSLIGWLAWSICGLLNDEQTPSSCLSLLYTKFIKNEMIIGNGALWFLLTLFFVRQIGNFLLRYNYAPLIACFASFAIAFLLYYVRWDLHSWWFGNFFSGLCFFLLGNLLKDKEQIRWVFILSTFVYGLVVCAYYTGIIGHFPYLYMHANRMTSENYLLFYPTALAGIIMTNNVFRVLCKSVKFRILEYIGRNAMYFYITHWILFTIVVFVSKSFFHIESPAWLFAILLGSSVAFLPLISKFIGWLKKKSVFLNKML